MKKKKKKKRLRFVFTPISLIGTPLLRCAEKLYETEITLEHLRELRDDCKDEIKKGNNVEYHKGKASGLSLCIEMLKR